MAAPASTIYTKWPLALRPHLTPAFQHHTHCWPLLSIAAGAILLSSTVSLASEMIKLRYSKKLFRRSSSKSSTSSDGGDAGSGRGEIEWEVRPGGMLVQKRDGRGHVEVITVRVATGFSWHDVSIGATCTFGEYSECKFFCYLLANPLMHVAQRKAIFPVKLCLRLVECVHWKLV
jgi:hypothetical protein